MKKKSITFIPFLVLILIIFYFAFIHIRKVDVSLVDGYVLSVSNKELSSNLKSSKEENIKLVKINNNSTIYKAGFNYYIGEDDKERIYLDSPIFEKDNSRVWNYNSNSYINVEYTTVDDLKNIIVADKNIFNAVMNDQVDEDAYIFIRLQNDLFMNNEQISIKTVNQEITIPIYSIIYFSEEYLNYYFRFGDELIYKKVPFMASDYLVKVNGITMTYEQLLFNLGLINKAESREIVESEEPKVESHVESKAKKESEEEPIVIRDAETISTNVDFEPANPEYIKPEVSFDFFTGNVYSATGNLSITDPAFRIVTSPTFTLKIKDSVYLKKTFSKPGNIEIIGLLPNTTYEVEGYYTYKNANDEKVKKTFYTGTFTTKSISSLNAVNLSYKIDSVYQNKVELKNFVITNDANEEFFKGIKNISISIDGKDFNFNQDFVGKIRNKNEVNYSTPESLTSNKDYTGTIKIIDVGGNVLKANNDRFNARTSKKAPSVTVKTVEKDFTTVSIDIDLTNSDDVNLNNYKYEIYNSNGTLEQEGSLDSSKKTNSVKIENLETNEAYVVRIYGSYDLEDGNGVNKNVLLKEANVSTVPISSLNFAKFNLKQTDINNNSATFEMTLDLNSTNPLLIELLDRGYVDVIDNEGNKKTIKINHDETQKIINGETYVLEINGLSSNTEYTMNFQTILKQGDKEYDIMAISNITNFTTYKAPAYAYISNQFTNENMIDFDIQIIDEDGAIKSDRVLIEVQDSEGNYIYLDELGINKNPVRITLDKLEVDSEYKINAIAEDYNEGTTNITFENNHLLEGSRTLITRLGVSGNIRLENLLSVVTSNNIFDLNYTSNFRFDTSTSSINKIDTDSDNDIIKFSAKNGYANYSYYIPEYKNKPVIVKFKARYLQNPANQQAYLTTGAGADASFPLNLTNNYKDYEIEMIPDNGYVGFRVDEVNGNNNTTTIEVKEMQIIPYQNTEDINTLEMSIYSRDYIFTDTVIKSGNDKIKEPDGSNETGHIGNGYARITNKYTDEVYDFDYTGDMQEFIVPEDGTYVIETWGASGGDNYQNRYLYANSHGGRGGYSSGKITLKAGTKLYVTVGGRGKYGRSQAGGYNGGGNSGGSVSGSGSGGGATDIRIVKGDALNIDSLNSRIMVAGGGGGSDDASSCYENCDVDNAGNGGAGGGLYTEGAYINGVLHTRYSAGQYPYTTKNFSGTVVASSQLGKGENSSGRDNGGAGGGYYGGSSSRNHNGGSSGGSSYISGHIGCISVIFKDNLQKPKEYTKYQENSKYKGTFYVNLTDTNYEKTGTPEIPNNDFYVQIEKNGVQVSSNRYSMDETHKAVDYIVNYNFDKGSDYTVKLVININDRYYTISSVNFKTDDQIRTIRTVDEFFNMSSAGKFLIDADIDIRYTNRVISGEFNGNIDFQGHKLLRNAVNSSGSIFSDLGKGALIKNVDLHLWFDQAKSWWYGFSYYSSATFDNIFLTVEEATETPFNNSAFIVYVNRGTINNFVVKNKAEIHTTKYFGFPCTYNYGTIKNGYLYGERINGNHNMGSDSTKYIGAVAGYSGENSTMENIYSLIDVIGYKQEEYPYQERVGNFVGYGNIGKLKNVYSVFENEERNTTYDANVGYINYISLENSYYVSSRQYGNQKSKKLSKVALWNDTFQNNTLNSENAFNVEDFVKYGYYPQLKLNESMPKQDYLKLPEITDDDILTLISSKVINQTGSEAEIELLLRNSTKEIVKNVGIQYVETSIISQVDNSDGSSVVKVKIANPTKFISSYSLISISSLSNAGITYRKEYDPGDVVLNIDMYRDIDNENDWITLIKKYPSENFRLNKDLDFKGFVNPIITTTIYGKIDGQNHTIKNMTVDTGNGIVFSDYRGTISNLYFENLKKLNKASYSGIFGIVQYGATIDNVHAKNITLKVGDYTGGMTSRLYYSSNIINSSVNGLELITTTNIPEARIGGMIGRTDQSNIINSYAANINLDVLDSNQVYAVGGLVGHNYYGQITNSYAHGTINSSYPNSGGIIGYNIGRVENVISDVTLITSQIFGGGIVGYDQNDDVSNTLSLGEIYTANEKDVHRTLGNKTLTNHNYYAWSGQKINGISSTLVAGEMLLDTEDLLNPETYETLVDVGKSFDFKEFAKGMIPKVYYANSEKLLPNQPDIKLDLDVPDIKVKSIEAEKSQESANVTIIIDNPDPSRFVITGIKVEDILPMNDEDLSITNQNPNNETESIIKFTMKPKYYLDSYRVATIYYTDNGTPKEENVNSKIDVEFYRSINSIDDFQRINPNYAENYIINTDLDFSRVDSSILKTGLTVNKLYGNNHIISNYNYTTNKGETYIFKEVREYMKDLTFKDITITYTGSGTTSGIGVIGSSYGSFTNINIDGLNLQTNKKASYVGFIAHSFASEYKNINIKDVNITGTNRLGSLYAEGDTYDLAYVDLKNVTIEGTGDHVGGMVGYRHDLNKAVHFNITADNMNVSTTGGNYSGGIYGYGCAMYVTITNSNVSGNQYVGGISGYQDVDTIYNQYVTSTNVTGKSNYTGGLYGQSRHIHSSYYKNGTINGANSTGGLVGYSSYSLYNSVVADATIIGKDYVGGIEGQAADGSRYNNTLYNVKVTGNNYVGGAIGYHSGTGSSAIYNNVINANVTALVKGAGGVLGWNRNNLEEENVRRTPIYNNILANVKVTAPTDAGGLIGTMDKETDPSLNLVRNNVLVVSVNSETSGSSGILVGSSDLYMDSTELNNIYEKSTINGNNAREMAYVKSTTGRFVSLDYMKNPDNFKTMVGGTTNYNYTFLNSGYYPKNTSSITYEDYSIPLPTESNISFLASARRRTLAKPVEVLPEVKVYSSGINTINFDFDTTGMILSINNEEYEINKNTMSFYYNYNEDINFVVKGSTIEKEYLIKKETLRRTLLTNNNDYYYLKDGTIKTKDEEVKGSYIHAYEDKILSSNGFVYNINTKEISPISISNFEKLKEAIPIVSYTHQNSVIKTYYNYSYIDDKKIDNQIFIKNGNIGMVNTAFDNQKDMIIIDKFNDSKILLTISNGKLTSLMEDINTPLDFKNGDIKEISSNIYNDSDIILVRYEDDSVYAFNYKYAKEVELPETSNNNTLVKFFANYFDETIKTSDIVSYENEYEKTNKFIGSVKESNIISFDTSKDESTKSNKSQDENEQEQEQEEGNNSNNKDNENEVIQNDYAVSYNPLKNEYEVYNVEFLFNKNTKEEDLNTSVNDYLNKMPTVTKEIKTQYKSGSKKEENVNGKYIIIVIIAVISIALGILGFIIRNIASQKEKPFEN